MEHTVRLKTLATRAARTRWAKSYDAIHNTFTVPCEKSKMASFASLIMKNIVVCSALFRFAVKLICCIALGSASGACCLLKSIAIVF